MIQGSLGVRWTLNASGHPLLLGRLPDRLVPAHLILFNQQTRMFPWQSNAKPDEGEQWVWQPVHPAEVFVRVCVRKCEIQPDVEELIGTQPRNVVRAERVR